MLERMNPRNTMTMFILTRMRKKCSQEVGGGDDGGDFEPVKLNVSFYYRPEPVPHIVQPKHDL